MLRVRPVHFTSDLDQFAATLEAQGLRCVENYGDWRVFDSGNGRVGVHLADAGSAMDGATVLGFEVRDHRIFVQRTLDDGTAAEVVNSRHGSTARVTAPDGFNFLADPVADAALPETASPCAVTVLWRTPDVAAANKVLGDIGAKFVSRQADGAVFRAKNGGFVTTAHGEGNGVELVIGKGPDAGEFHAASES